MSIIRRGEYEKPLLVLQNGVPLIQVDFSGDTVRKIEEDMTLVSSSLFAINSIVTSMNMNLENINIIERVEGNNLILDKLSDFVVLEEEGNSYIFITFSKKYHFNRNLKEAFQKIIKYCRNFSGEVSAIFERVRDQYHLFRLLLREQESNKIIPIKSLTVGDAELYEGLSQAIIPLMKEIFGIEETHYVIGAVQELKNKYYFYTSPFLEKFQELFETTNFDKLKEEMFEFYNEIPSEVWPLIFIFHELSNKYSYMEKSGIMAMMQEILEIVKNLPENQRSNVKLFKKMMMHKIAKSSEDTALVERITQDLIEEMQS